MFQPGLATSHCPMTTSASAVYPLDAQAPGQVGVRFWFRRMITVERSG